MACWPGSNDILLVYMVARYVMELFHVIYSPLQITRPAVKHSFFFCLGWLEQKQIRAYISEYQLQI